MDYKQCYRKIRNFNKKMRFRAYLKENVIFYLKI
jgi:hypothetical protein